MSTCLGLPRCAAAQPATPFAKGADVSWEPQAYNWMGYGLSIWSTAATTDADADLTQSYGYASSYQLGYQKATAYQVRTYQLLANAPNGTYALRALTQSSGSQLQCQLYANGFGGTELATTLPTAGPLDTGAGEQYRDEQRTVRNKSALQCPRWPERWHR